MPLINTVLHGKHNQIRVNSCQFVAKISFSDNLLDKAIDTVMSLPLEQQEMLLEIIRSRHIEFRRQEIAHDAQQSLSDFHAGQYKPQSAADTIAELRQSLTES